IFDQLDIAFEIRTGCKVNLVRLHLICSLMMLSISFTGGSFTLKNDNGDHDFSNHFIHGNSIN
ncbi:MAG TPA: hypothetical protein VJ761_11580, partial [Ktedonobacteraceae bacterium]|nr:hypothetical protein [Ktedonobacteraceae bacterium]